MQNSKTSKVGNSNKAIKATAISGFDSRSLVTSIGAERPAFEYRPKETIFRQGDPADAVFYLQKGKVQIAVVSKQGKEGVVAILDAGQFLGEGCLTGQPLRLASASAIEESTVVRIEKETMARLLHEQPAFGEMFMAFLLSRNIQIEADLVDQLFNSSERRLARTLLLLAHFGKEGKMEAIVPKISQEVLAARVGTTRSRINFFMNKFRKLGFIEYNGETVRRAPLRDAPSGGSSGRGARRDYRPDLIVDDSGCNEPHPPFGLLAVVEPVLLALVRGIDAAIRELRAPCPTWANRLPISFVMTTFVPCCSINSSVKRCAQFNLAQLSRSKLHSLCDARAPIAGGEVRGNERAGQLLPP